MRRWKLAATLTALAVGASAPAQTVTLTLDSPQAGQTVPAGGTIQWSIFFTVSTGDNQGLALLAVDLVQDSGNPATLDIPPAEGVPPAMSNFSRPAGISNPGETDPLTGYIGVQRGAAGAKNLVQIGGGQNTFGQALPPGSGIAENAVVAGGVGQSGPVLLASGSFAAPGTRGLYTFRLANAVANVLEQVNSPPNFSPVVEAAVDTAAGAFSVTVGVQGDVDGDGDVDLSDLALLLAAYGSSSGEPAYNPDADLDSDGDVDLADLALLLANYGFGG